jgi:hypothetical protein
MGGDPGLSKHGFTLRTATKDDLDAITWIHIEGFTEEPRVHYCYPFRHQYPEDHWKWTRKEYENYLEQPQKYVVYVLEAPSEADGNIVYKPVGHAVWNIAVLTSALGMGTFKSLQYFISCFTNLCPYRPGREGKKGRGQEAMRGIFRKSWPTLQNILCKVGRGASQSFVPCGSS